MIEELLSAHSQGLFIPSDNYTIKTHVFEIHLCMHTHTKSYIPTGFLTIIEEVEWKWNAIR